MFWCWNHHIDGLVQGRHNSIANAVEFCLSGTKPSISPWKLTGGLATVLLGGLNVRFEIIEICSPYFDGLMQHCSISIANALEILQSCTKTWISSELWFWGFTQQQPLSQIHYWYPHHEFSGSYQIVEDFSINMHLTHLPLDKMADNVADYIFNQILLDENVWISIKISLKFVPKGPIDNNPA